VEYSASKDVSFLGFFSHVTSEGTDEESFAVILIRIL